jgi:hypothetical protein
MSRVKSILQRVKIDTAGKAHNCQANSSHRIDKGGIRLKVRNGRSWDHYCSTCAENILARDIQRLTELQRLEVMD